MFKGDFMMLKIGTIMKIEGDKVYVLTVGIDMLVIKKKPTMFIGQQIAFLDKDILKVSKLQKYIYYTSRIAAVLIIGLILYFYFSQTNNKNIYAYVDIDINSSIELEINDENNIIKCLPINKDASYVLNEVNVVGKNVKDAILQITKKSTKMGYIDKKNSMVLISCILNTKNPDYSKSKRNINRKFDELLRSLYEEMNEQRNDGLNLKVIKVDENIKMIADKNGISTGKQVIYMKARERGYKLTIGEVKEKNIDVLEELLSNNKNDKDSINDEKTTTPNIIESPEKTTTLTPKVTPKVTPKEYGKTTIKVTYYNDPMYIGDTIQINAEFKIDNIGNEIVDLSRVKFRYFYTIDGKDTRQFFDCWATVGNKNIIANFIKMENKRNNTDYYLEMGFKIGKLAPDQSTIVNTWFNKDNWTVYKQDNDYSYNGKYAKDYYDYDKVTGYIDGKLVWGIEP
jgi:hypothetical protein